MIRRREGGADQTRGKEGDIPSLPSICREEEVDRVIVHFGGVGEVGVYCLAYGGCSIFCLLLASHLFPLPLLQSTLSELANQNNRLRWIKDTYQEI